jgi:hypothetical protein
LMEINVMVEATRRRQGPIFRQRDVSRAVRAAARAGLKGCTVEIDRKGTIRLIPGKPDDGKIEDSGGKDEWGNI